MRARSKSGRPIVQNSMFFRSAAPPGCCSAILPLRESWVRPMWVPQSSDLGGNALLCRGSQKNAKNRALTVTSAGFCAVLPLSCDTRLPPRDIPPIAAPTWPAHTSHEDGIRSPHSSYRGCSGAAAAHSGQRAGGALATPSEMYIHNRLSTSMRLAPPGLAQYGTRCQRCREGCS